MVAQASTYFGCRCLPILLPNPGIHGHHALIFYSGGDVVKRHNHLSDSFADFCHRACHAPELESGCQLTSTKDRSRPVDLLVPNWSLTLSRI